MSETEDAPTGDRSDEPARSPGVRPGWLLAIGGVLVGYAVALAVFAGDEALAAVRRAALPWLAAGLLLQVAVMLTWPLVHRASLRAVGGDLTYGQALQVSMSAFTTTHSAPGGGALGAAVAVDRLTRFGVPGPMATASVSLTGPLALLTIAVIGAAGIGTAVFLGDLPSAALIPTGLVLAGLLVGIGFLVVGMRSPAVGERAINAVGRLHRRLRAHREEWLESWRSITEHAPGTADLARIVAWATAKWTADVASLAVVFIALDETPRLSMLLVAFGVSQILGAIPATPGAAGIVEGGLIGVFTAFGVPFGTATTVAVAYRVLEAWLPTLAGIPVLLRVPERA